MQCIRKSFCSLAIAGWSIAVLVAVGQAADGSEIGLPVVVPISPDGVQRAKIILDSYSYSPNHLVVESGKEVELTLVSVTTITPHNFIIREPSAGLVVEQDVSAGKTVTAKFMPTQPGRFPFLCDKRLWPMPSHRDKGMEGILEVK